MSSVISVLLREQIRLLKPILTNMSVEKMRIAQDKLGLMGSKALASKALFFDFDLDGVPSCFVTPNALTEELMDKIILYLHGGAYVAGDLTYARGFAGVLASTLNTCVMCSAYRLAPENPYPAALVDAKKAYVYLISRGYDPKNITLVGESAGGGLLLALTLKLKADSIPLPGKLVPISPWTDLTLSGESYIKNEKRDPSLSIDNLRVCADMYARGDEANPFISPLFGDLTKFPPTLMFVGEDELLLDDAKIMNNRLNAAGCNSQLIIEEGMWHAYPLYGVPEAKRALNLISSFLRNEQPLPPTPK